MSVVLEKLWSFEDFAMHWKTFPRRPLLIMAPPKVDEGDKMRATEILPAEIWDMLLNKLEDPEDLHAAHNSCSMFDKLLTNKRAIFLFPSILPILMEKGLATEEQKELDTKVLPLRSVCRTWKSGVNAHCQSWEYLLRYLKENLPEFNPFNFETRENIERFMTKMSNHTSNANPFFTGLVQFSDFHPRHPNEVIQYWDAVTSTLLPQFGQHIIYCEVESRKCLDPSQSYRVLAQVLSQLPALRYLSLYPDLKEHASLTEQIRRAPLPYFQNLKALQILYTAVTVTNEVLRAASKCQLQTLVAHFRDDKEEALFTASSWEFIDQLSNLKEVSLYAFSSYSSLIKLTHANWSITRLDLTVIPVDDGSQLGKDQISIFRLFQTLSTLGDKSTIRDLTLTLEGPGEIGVELRLNLPLLENFDLHCDFQGVAVNSLDFAVEMKALKSLKIDGSAPFPTKRNEKEVIKFSGCVNNMEASNIWTVLPNLEQLSLKDSYPAFVYYRQTGPRSLFWREQRQRGLRCFWR